MVRVVCLVTAVLCLVCTTATAEVTQNVKLPIMQQVFVSCAANGAGDLVTLSGDLHVLMTVTVNANRVSFSAHFQPQGVSGIGSTTGDTYRGTGVTRYNTNMDSDNPFPFETTLVNNFRMIGQGPGNNLTVHETFHLTINANGQVTAMVDHFKTECK